MSLKSAQADYPLTAINLLAELTVKGKRCFFSEKFNNDWKIIWNIIQFRYLESDRESRFELLRNVSE